MHDSDADLYKCARGHVHAAASLHVPEGQTRPQCPECGAAVKPHRTPAAPPAPPPRSASPVPSPIPSPRRAAPPAGQNTSPTPAPRAPDPGTPQVAGYQLLAEIGRGAMGVVYKARHERLKRVVALKMILVDGQAGQQPDWFQAEAEAVAHLHHPHIVQIYEVGEQDGRPFLALEFVGGGTLHKRLEGKPQPIRAAVQLVEMIARAVHTAHQRGIVHRDLKPANILLDRTQRSDGGDDLSEAEQLYGVPKVTDFGLAVRIDRDFDPANYRVVGSPMYMAPEQAAGDTEEVGPPADIYSLGGILYEMLSGKAIASSAQELLAHIRGEAIAPLRGLRKDVPRDLEAIAMRCLQREPRQRYRSALALAEDLQRFLEGRPVLARKVGPLARALVWSRQNPAAAALLLTGLVTLAVGNWRLRHLSSAIVERSAHAGAAQQTALINQVYDLYSGVAKQVREADGKIPVTHLYPDATQKSIPIPARFAILLGESMEALGLQEHADRTGHSFSKLHLFSNYPFRQRAGNPPKPGTFAADALAFYAQHAEQKDEPFARIGTDDDERPVLRYATALKMKASCLGCHNNRDNYEPGFRENARTDWKEGDPRGVLVIDVPLAREYRQTDDEVFGTWELLAGIAAATFLLAYAGLRWLPR